MNRIEEKEAYLILQLLWPYFSNNYYNGESPDLQNDIDSVGIEITQAVTNMPQKYAKINNLVANMHSTQNPQVVQELIYTNKDGLLTKEDKTPTNEIIQVCQNRIKIKLEKFNKNYKHYQTNGLFLFIRNSFLTKTNVKEIYEYFHSINMNMSKKVDMLFIYDGTYFSYNNMNNKNPTIIEVEDDIKIFIYNIL